MKKTDVKNLVQAALFLALALVLPFLTGQIPEIGAMLCPMHIPPCSAVSSADGPGDWGWGWLPLCFGP